METTQAPGGAPRDTSMSTTGWPGDSEEWQALPFDCAEATNAWLNARGIDALPPRIAALCSHSLAALNEYNSPMGALRRCRSLLCETGREAVLAHARAHALRDGASTAVAVETAGRRGRVNYDSAAGRLKMDWLVVTRATRRSRWPARSIERGFGVRTYWRAVGLPDDHRCGLPVPISA